MADDQGKHPRTSTIADELEQAAAHGAYSGTRDHRDRGQHWAGIAESGEPPDTYIDHADAWETITSPPDLDRKAVEPPLGYPGREEQHRPAPGYEALLIRTEHPLDTHERVPDRLAAMSVNVDATPRRLVGVNRRRAALMIVPQVNVIVGDVNVTQSNGLALGAFTPLSIATTDEVWIVLASGATAGRCDVLQTWHDQL
ncbi:MAG TPA: hypothetical protein VFC99_05680 [Acidimicrobiia bacterium]|nr:hypothetical protein [Acidimicrobiia bacterium]